MGYSPWGHKELDMTLQLNLYEGIAVVLLIISTSPRGRCGVKLKVGIKPNRKQWGNQLHFYPILQHMPLII